MKPKNSVFCPECGHSKMLFESEAKAMNFIRFNSEEIEELNGKAPVRAYFCEACAGWHLTSSKKALSYSPTERVIRNTQALNEEYYRQITINLVQQKMERLRNIIARIQEGLYFEAYTAYFAVLTTITNYELRPNATQGMFAEIKSQGPEIAEMLLSKMHEELITLKAEPQKDEELFKQKKKQYQNAINKLRKKGEAYKKCYIKHDRLIRFDF